MKPEAVKSIRLSLRTSRGKPPSQKKLAEFLRMGSSTIARYELGVQQPTGTSIHLLRLCQSPEAVKLMAIHNQRDGLFSDIE